VRRARLLGVAILVTALSLLAIPATAEGAAKPKSVYTPVLAQLLAPNHPAPVLGTDHKYHVLYELRLSNRGPLPATIQQLVVFDADSHAVIRTYEGPDLQARFRDIGGVTAPDTVIAPGEERVFLVDLEFGLSFNVPAAVGHRLVLLGPAGPSATEPTPVSYSIATVPVDGPTATVLTPPLKGNGWVATNGCCDIASADRTTILPVNGGLWSPLRFSIDLAQLDDTGLFVHDDPAQLRNYTGYGTDVLAAAPGQVVAALDTLPDQPAGPPPGSAANNFESADGNYVVVDLGNGSFVLYGNLQPGSLTVKVGDHVQRREVLGTIGNSGDSAFPHLEFRLMSGPSPVGSDGLPFVLSGFAYEGQLDAAQYQSQGVVGNYLQSRAAQADPRRRELPLDLAIIDFGEPGGAGAVGRT